MLPEEGAEWWCDAYVVADLLGIIWKGQTGVLPHRYARKPERAAVYRR